MQLRLKYNEQALQPAAATLINGQDVSTWLIEIDRWQKDINQLRYFVLPASLQSTACTGLLVIFPDLQFASGLTLQHPYIQVADGFYIPVNASLFPMVLAEELNALKRYDVQLFHPSIGLIGFDYTDALSLEALIASPGENNTGWMKSYPKPVRAPRLEYIQLESKEMPQNALESLKENLDVKELSEIPGQENEQSQTITIWKKLMRLLTTLALGILLGLVLLGQFIISIVSKLFPINNYNHTNQRSGLLKRLEGWINNRLKDLEKQRDSELNRLMKLFEKDDDEALRYAIPLDSPYLNRGTAPKKGKLIRRNFDLSFRGFGSGGAVDSWSVDGYEQELRKQYQKSIENNIAKGDYKKAAYIYAHLLGNLYMAAQTLQQGKHYREAAGIYKDHLLDISKAAECLEKGGLLHEAIPLYIELGSFEKAGDLHTVLGQKSKADIYYEEVVKNLLDAKDYLNAARLVKEKVGNEERGQSLLLDGWNANNQAEVCLHQYLEAAGGDDAELMENVQDVFAEHVPRYKRNSFLTVIANLADQRRSENLRSKGLQIAYDVVHQQLGNGEQSGLQLLSRFLPEDPLVSQDTNRYRINHYQKTKTASAFSHIQLSTDYEWLDAINYHDQILAVGLKNDQLNFARANWDRKINYGFLFKTGDFPKNYRLLADPYVSKHVILFGNIPVTLTKHQDTYSYFKSEFYLHQLNGLDQSTIAVGFPVDGEKPNILKDQKLSLLKTDGTHVLLNDYSFKKELIEQHYCTLAGERIATSNIKLQFSEMFWRKEHFYFIGYDSLLRIDGEARLAILPFEQPIINFSVTNPNAVLKVAVLTNEGCQVIAPALNGFEASTEMFAQDFPATHIQLLPDNRLLLASSRTAKLFDIAKAIPSLLCEVETDNDIQKILTVPQRYHFAFLEKGGRITIHKLEQDD